MLTDFDREWLERRRKICLRCEFGPSEKHPKGLCWRGRYCGWDKLECDMFTAPRTGLTLPDMKEAAEFEAIASMVLTVTFPFRFLRPDAIAIDASKSLSAKDFIRRAVERFASFGHVAERESASET